MKSIFGQTTFIWESVGLNNIARDLENCKKVENDDFVELLTEKVADARILMLQNSGVVRRAMAFRKNSPYKKSADQKQLKIYNLNWT